MDTATYRPGRRRAETFKPSVMYHAVKSIFREYGKKVPGHRVKSHDLRKRAITRLSRTLKNPEVTAHLIGIDPQTARRFYIDAARAHSADELLRKVAAVLLPEADNGAKVGRSAGRKKRNL